MKSTNKSFMLKEQQECGDRYQCCTAWCANPALSSNVLSPASLLPSTPINQDINSSAVKISAEPDRSKAKRGRPKRKLTDNFIDVKTQLEHQVDRLKSHNDFLLYGKNNSSIENMYSLTRRALDAENKLSETKTHVQLLLNEVKQLKENLNVASSQLNHNHANSELMHCVVTYLQVKTTGKRFNSS